MDWNKKPVGGPKYGLQLKIAVPAAKKPQLKKPLPFSLDGSQDEYTVEDDIARQASKKQSAHEVDVQIKQALEQDLNAFDYDGIYDQMKGQQARPIREDRAKREVKYIGRLLDKAKVRSVEQDIAYERRLAKEREKEDHLFGDKEKFVTSAYKKKLIELGKWKEEERLRELEEKSHEVTGKRDLGDFYRNLLSKNVAFGGKETGKGKLHPEVRTQEDRSLVAAEQETSSSSRLGEQEGSAGLDERNETADGKRLSKDELEAGPSLGTPPGKQQLAESPEANKEGNFEAVGGKPRKIGLVPSESAGDRRSKEESLAAAKERYLARKKQRND